MEREKYNYTIAGYSDDASRLYVYIQVSATKDDVEQATILQERVQSRGNLAYFDPTSVDKSLANLRACRAIKEVLEQKGEKVITITTDHPFDALHFKPQIYIS